MVSGDLTGFADALGTGENFVANFQLENQAVRGRAARLGMGSVNEILNRHDYPPEAARLLGEALTLAVLVASSLKFDGRLTVQAEGDGPVRLMVAEYSTNGNLRGYLRLDNEKWAKLEKINEGLGRPHPAQAFGKGVLTMTILQDNPHIQPYQGIVPLDGRSLAECAEHYFMQSEQVPTRVRIAVGQIQKAGEAPVWQAGGALIQRIAGDDARGDTEDDWNTAEILFQSVYDSELLDPDLSVGRVLYRLFHERGVRFESPTSVQDACTCSEERLRKTLESMPDEGLIEMAAEDNSSDLKADCQFCGRKYRIPLTDVLNSVQ